VKNDPDRAGRQGARVRVTCRGLPGNFLSWWHVLHNNIQYVTYIQVINVGRLNYVYLHKYSTFTDIVTPVYTTHCTKNSVQGAGVSVTYRGVSGKFCHGDIFTQCYHVHITRIKS